MRVLVILVVGCPCLFDAIAIDYGPTYGMDYVGMDYNVTPWHSDPSKSANHWQAAADECETYCLNDPNCCTWTYCTPEAGSNDPERCCLKNAIPSEVPAATHWTGAAPRANTTQCTSPPPAPWPGPAFMAPKITNAPPCVYGAPNWHDVAGALVTSDGTFHVFQGCASYGGVPAGWHHATSTNLVDWVNHGIEPTLSALAEPYGTSSPCSGFMVVDDDGIPCAGFRECGGNWPGRMNTQVPLELRCALTPQASIELNNFSAPEYIFWFYFNRNLPYDPVRPWKDANGQWYATISADACNNTVPCAGGGAEYLFTSPALRGPRANWTLLPSLLFSSNWTVETPLNPSAIESHEFVTAGYFGALPGDPLGGATRCLTNNIFDAGFSGTTAYFCGTQAYPGAPLIVNESSPYSRGMIDWGYAEPADNGLNGVAALRPSGSGAFKMARTLSPSSPNQVASPGRKIMVAWLDLGGAGQSGSLPRDLSLDPTTGELLQQLSPELQTLRTGDGDPASVWSQQLEIIADFTLLAGINSTTAEFGVDVLVSADGNDRQSVRVLLGEELVVAGGKAGPLLGQPAVSGTVVHVHAIVDHSILTVIVNNRTAVTTYVAPRDAGSGGVELTGVDDVVVSAVWQAWVLRDANITYVPSTRWH